MFLDVWCSRCVEQEIFFDWRPTLRDPDDDMLLELAVAGRVNLLITSNVGDFAAASRAVSKSFVVPPSDIRAAQAFRLKAGLQTRTCFTENDTAPRRAGLVFES